MLSPAQLSAVNQDFGAAFEEHFDLGFVFDSGSDADTEARVFHDITGLIFLFGGIILRCFGISFQKALIAAGPRLSGLKFGNSLTWLGRFISVLGIARIAVHARRSGADHRLDRVGEHHFAFAAPTVDSRGGSNLVVSFHYVFLLRFTKHTLFRQFG